MSDRYLRPTEVGAALASLADGHRTVIAGGTDFYPASVGRPLDEPVLDISALRELRAIGDEGGHYRIGALATWTDLQRADLPACFDGLKLAAREVGGVQIQNAGTICGNVCNASPAADGVPNLLALDAAVELRSMRGPRLVPIGQFITGNRRTVREADELVSALLVPMPSPGARSAFSKLGARRYLVISIVMVAGVAAFDEHGCIADARIAVGACSAVARRLPDLERALIGLSAAEDPAALVHADHLAPVAPIDDIRGTADYRRDAAVTLVRRVVADLVVERR